MLGHVYVTEFARWRDLCQRRCYSRHRLCRVAVVNVRRVLLKVYSVRVACHRDQGVLEAFAVGRCLPVWCFEGYSFIYPGPFKPLVSWFLGRWYVRRQCRRLFVGGGLFRLLGSAVVPGRCALRWFRARCARSQCFRRRGLGFCLDCCLRGVVRFSFRLCRRCFRLRLSSCCARLSASPLARRRPRRMRPASGSGSVAAPALLLLSSVSFSFLLLVRPLAFILLFLGRQPLGWPVSWASFHLACGVASLMYRIYCSRLVAGCPDLFPGSYLCLRSMRPAGCGRRCRPDGFEQPVPHGRTGTQMPMPLHGVHELGQRRLEPLRAWPRRTCAFPRPACLLLMLPPTWLPPEFSVTFYFSQSLP